MPFHPCQTDQEIKSRLREILKTRSDGPELASCLDAIELSLENEELKVSFKYAFYALFFKNRLQQSFENLVHSYLGSRIAISYGPGDSPIPAYTAPIEPQSDPFADFIERPGNSAALSAAKMLSACAEPAFNLVIFTGPSGSGKSCLLEAIQSAFACKPSISVFKCRAAAFSAEGLPEEYFAEPRSLLLDDLQELIGHSPAQTLLCNYLDAINYGHSWSRIALAFCGSDLTAFEPRFWRRLSQGLILQLPAPDLSLRITFTERAARRLGLTLAKNQILALARHSSKISVITGLLRKMKFYTSFSSATLPLAELEKLVLPENSTQGWQRILARIAEKLELKPSDIMGSSRRREFVRARQAAMFLCRTRLGLSYPELGRIFGGKDHSTVIHSIKKIKQLRLTDRVLHKLLTELEAESE